MIFNCEAGFWYKIVNSWNIRNCKMNNYRNLKFSSSILWYHFWNVNIICNNMVYGNILKIFWFLWYLNFFIFTIYVLFDIYVRLKMFENIIQSSLI